MNKLNTTISNISFGFTLQSPEIIEKFMQPTLRITSLEGGREIDVGNKSQGYLRKLLISDFLLLTKNIGLENENGRILLIEEPEIHMHINAQKEIISVLKENLLEGNSQVFITTHSHTMIEGADLENIYVFRKEPASGITNVKNLRQISIFNREEILKEIIDSLGVKSTDLLFLKKIILLLEGENDVAFIKGLCERPEISIDTEKILFKSASGQASISYYAGMGEFLDLKTMIIYDNHKVNKRDIENLKNNPYISDQLRNNIFRIVMLEKPDILDYFDLEFVADYKGIPRENIPQENQNTSMKNFLRQNNKRLSSKEVESLAKSIPRIPKELNDKIINFLKLVLI